MAAVDSPPACADPWGSQTLTRKRIRRESAWPTARATPFFISQNAHSAFASQRDAQAIDENGSLVTVPYFPLPPINQLFEDTEGRFPMKDLEKLLAESDVGPTFWYARVLPENGDPARAEYLSLDRDPVDGKLKLRRRLPTNTFRYLLTLIARDEDQV